MAKDPESLVEVERRIQLLQKGEFSKTKFLILGSAGVAFGVLLLAISGWGADPLLAALGGFSIVAGIVNMTAAYWKPQSIARRIAHLELLAEAMEAQSFHPITASQPDTLKSETTRTCPFCAEVIQSAAIVCKHCGRDLRSSGGWTASTRAQARMELENPTKPENGFGTAALIAGLVGLILPVPFVAPLAAMILRTIGDYKVSAMKATNTGMAVAGAVLGVVGFLAWIVITFAVLLPWMT